MSLLQLLSSAVSEAFSKQRHQATDKWALQGAHTSLQVAPSKAHKASNKQKTVPGAALYKQGHEQAALHSRIAARDRCRPQ